MIPTAVTKSLRGGHVDVAMEAVRRYPHLLHVRPLRENPIIHEMVQKATFRVDDLDVLVKLGADLALRTGDGLSVLYFASLSTDELALQIQAYLQARGLSLTPYEQILVDISAPSELDLSKVRSELKRDPLVVHHRGPDGWTLLHNVAYSRGDEQRTYGLAKLLVEGGADVNSLSYTSATPAGLSRAGKQHARTRDYLAARGARPSHLEELGILVGVGETDGVRHFLEEEPEYLHRVNPLTADLAPWLNFIARFYKQQELARYMLEKGVNPNATDRRGETALHCAAEGNSAEMVELLIRFRGDPNAKDDRDWTPLQTAAVCGGDRRTMELLVRAGTDVNNRDVFGKTALDRARSGTAFRGAGAWLRMHGAVSGEELTQTTPGGD